MQAIIKAAANLPVGMPEGQSSGLFVDQSGKLHVTGGGGSSDATAALQTAGNASLTSINSKLPAALGPTTPALSLSTIQASSTSIVTGQAAVTTTAAQLASTATYKNGIKLTNLSTSASPLFYGPSGVTATTGDELPAGQSVVLPVSDPSLIYVITASSTATASFAGLP
jgi:hypothetical protein